MPCSSNGIARVPASGIGSRCATGHCHTEWGWKAPAAGLSQQAGEAEDSRTAETCGEVGAVLATTGRVGTSRRRGSGKQDETPYERNQCLTSRNGSTGSSLEDLGRVQRTPPEGGDFEAGLSMPVGRPR